MSTDAMMNLQPESCFILCIYPSIGVHSQHGSSSYRAYTRYLLKNIILALVLYECENWSLTVRVFENRVMRIFGPKRDAMMGGWRKLHDLCSSSSVIIIVMLRRSRLAGLAV
jgi:hypothetical protein